MIRKSETKKDSLYRRRRTRELTIQGREPHQKRSLSGINRLHLSVSLLMIALGLFSVFLVVKGDVREVWITSTLSLLGSLNVMTGVWLCYETVTERKSIDNMVKGAIKRSISDKN